MTGENLFYAFASIDDEFITRAEAGIRQITHSKKQVLIKKIVLTSVCFCTVLFIVGLFNIFNSKSNTPFALSAYAADSNGNAVKKELEFGSDIPVNIFASESGAKTFVFSYENKDQTAKPQIAMVYSDDYSQSGNSFDNITIVPNFNSLQLNNGEIYICYTFRKESNSYNFKYRTIPNNKNVSYELDISIYKKSGNYFARLNLVSKTPN